MVTLPDARGPDDLLGAAATDKVDLVVVKYLTLLKRRHVLTVPLERLRSRDSARLPRTAAALVGALHALVCLLRDQARARRACRVQLVLRLR
eukprot:197402-Chlamydomonas_euryale.AAC.3